ncbi:YdeI/OmpD-associated family protein [Kribbella voronezhensis]|nr:YdeI/OmpD-associated family protein [Kribbella voronezhensis]
MSTQTAQVVTDESATELATVAEWREWLTANADAERSVWLVIHNKTSGRANFEMPELVEQALCFGWIDAKAIRRDGDSRYQQFTRRNPRSTWSRINRDRIEKLTAAGLMTPAGQELVEQAKKSGAWDCLAEAQAGIIPADLQTELDRNPVAANHFAAFPPSSQVRILSWIAGAKRPETRHSRITEAVALATINCRANHPN